MKVQNFRTHSGDPSSGLSHSACPACDAAPLAGALAASRAGTAAAGSAGQGARLTLSLPRIHCSSCISGVERVLSSYPGVTSARVNLSLKRANVNAAPGVRGDELVRALIAAGFEAQELDAAQLGQTEGERTGRDLAMRVAVSGFAMMNVMLLSVAVWSGAADATRDLFHWLSAAIALPAVAFSAQPFFRNAWTGLKARRLNMDVPITLAIVLALGTSLWETALSGAHAWFDAALSLTFFLLVGRWLDHRTRAAAHSAAAELSALEVARAIRLDPEGDEVEVPVSELRPGMLIRVHPGSRMPVDGEIVDGRSELDRSLLTGESDQVFAGPGGMVSAGEVNLTGVLTVRATAVGEDSSLRRLAGLVAVAESGRSRYNSLADRAARAYAPGVHALAGLALAGWWIATGDPRLALNIAAAVLIITCPCALGLAVPAVTTAASGRLFRKGLLVKHQTALERLAEIDTVVFDKTGTLTRGTPRPVELMNHDRRNLEVALALAEGTAHPLARALVRGIRDGGLTAARVSELREVPGYGTTGIWEGVEVRLGRGSWVGAPDARTTATWLRIGDERPVAFVFEDAEREGAAEVVAAFRARGIAVELLSGDAVEPVRTLADRLGIADWRANVLPAAKAARIEALQQEGRRVLMVGDGLNDTAALAMAHVSISPASALDAARAASDIVLLGSNLEPVAEAVTLAGTATRRIRENFAIAAAYNVVAIPVAMLGFATPLLAALAMSLSSISVSLNALRLGRDRARGAI